MFTVCNNTNLKAKDEKFGELQVDHYLQLSLHKNPIPKSRENRLLSASDANGKAVQRQPMAWAGTAGSGCARHGANAIGWPVAVLPHGTNLPSDPTTSNQTCPPFRPQGLSVAPGNFGSALKTLWAIFCQNLKQIEVGKRFQTSMQFPFYEIKFWNFN